MDKSLRNRKIDIPKFAIVTIGEIFAVISIIIFARGADWTRSVAAALSMFTVLLPTITELLLRQKMTLPCFLIGMLYAIGPMLGLTYRMYFILPWWDKLLHFTGGVIFALIGFEIARKLCRGKANDVSIWLIAFFGICFSVTLSALWEFTEYAVDVTLALDMQTDTVVTSISSYNLTSDPEVRTSIEGINEVVVNGSPLGLGGYLDIGLHDTMADMIVETLGAVIITAVFVIRKGAIAIFRKPAEENR